MTLASSEAGFLPSSEVRWRGNQVHDRHTGPLLPGLLLILLGATTAGVMFDRAGDYCLGLLVMAGLAGVGAALLGPMAVLQARSMKKI